MDAVKTCSKCEQERPLSDYQRRSASKDGRAAWCRNCYSSYNKQHRLRNPRKNEDARIQRMYGITLDDYDRMYINQSGRCAICGTDNPGRGKGRFSIDHCHDSDAVRGLLCDRCNLMLGHANDSIDTLLNAVKYLAG